MSLGFALLHETQVEMALSGDPIKIGFDDATDMVMAGVRLDGLPEETLAACEAALQTQFDEIGAQFRGLVEAGGPLAGLLRFSTLFDEDDFDIVGLIEIAANFMCDMQPATVHGVLNGLTGPLTDALPILDPVEIAARLQALVLCVVDALEAPLLSGRDDIAAHRGYRAATIFRIKVCPMFEGVEEFIAEVDIRAALQAGLDIIPNFDEALVEALRGAGCFLRDTILPLLRCSASFEATATIDLDPAGPSPLDGSPTQQRKDLLDLDTKPAPFDVGSGLWILDLATNAGAIAATLFDITRTGSPPKRGFNFVFTDLLIPTWMIFRTVARATRWEAVLNGPEPSGGPNPEEPAPGEEPALAVFNPGNDQKFVRALFSDYGDFSVQAILHFFGSISDMYAWSNWVSSMGLRLIRYYFFALQPRIPYLFVRAVDYLNTWKALPEDVRDESVRMPRFTWLHWGPVAVVGMFLGFIYGFALWEQFSIQNTGLLLGAIGAPAIGMALLSFFVTPHIVMGSAYDSFTVPTNEMRLDQWQGILVFAAIALVLVLAVTTFLETENVAESADEPGEITLWVVGGLIVGALLLPMTGAFGGAERGFFQVWMVIGSVMVPGLMGTIGWYYAVADSRDAEDVFDGRDAATSPYLLPYSAGDSWLCGQSFHGFFSHLYDSPTNHYSYDFNEDFGEKALATRTGLVVDIRDGMTDHNTRDANRVQLQHLDWVVGHDPGWDLERGLSYSGYLHLPQRRIFVNLGQLARQGYNVAEIDDTGVSAMNHLHFNIQSGQDQTQGIVNMPAVFRDGSVRRKRSFGWTPGKPGSLAFATSENTESTDPVPIEMELTLTAAPDGHDHDLWFTLAALDSDGTIPDPVVLTTEPGGAPGHVHQITLTREHVVSLLRRRDLTGVTTSTTDGHSHLLSPLPTVPPNGASRAVGGAQPTGTNNDTARLDGAQFELAAPPSATLLAREPGPHNIMGEQMVVRVNGETTQWLRGGVHRPKLPADLALDRAPRTPGPPALPVLRIDVGGNAANPSLTDHVMAATGARLLTEEMSAGVDAIVRAQPVLVVETRHRGSGAALDATTVPSSMELLTPAAVAGSGSIVQLDSVARGQLRDLIAAALTQQAGALPSVVVTGDSATVQVAGSAATAFGGSTPRLDQVLTEVSVSGLIDNANPLPLTSGVLRLDNGTDQLDVSIVGAPARVVVVDLAAARLEGDALVEEPLVVRVRDDDQTVTFDAAADTTPQAVAQRIMTQAEGVRCWGDGNTIVMETVAVGDDVRLALTKGVGGTGDAGTFPAITPGSAPALGGTEALTDSTAVTLATLRDLVNRSHAEAVKPTAPVTVQAPSGRLRIIADTPTDDVEVEGPPDLMAALNPAGNPTQGVGIVEFTGVPNQLSLPTGGWLDITVGSDTWRVHLTAEPARLDVALDGMPASGEALTFDLNGGAVNVGFRDQDVVSVHALADRIRDVAGDEVTVRVASRYAFESARHGRGDLEIGGGALPSPGFASAGRFRTPASQTGRGAYDDATAVATLDTGEPIRAGRTFAAFSTSTSGSVLTVTATDGGAVAIIPAGTDPFGLATGSMSGAPVPLGRESVGYQIQASNSTTEIEINAAPAHLHTDAGVGALTVAEDGAPLTVRTTDPTGRETSTTLDLVGIASPTDAATRIQRDAPHVRAWASGTRLDIDTPGGGTGWQLELEGAVTLIALGFDPARLDGEVLRASGGGNVADGESVGRAEVRQIIETMGATATLEDTEVFVASNNGGALAIEGRSGAPALSSEPAGLANALGSSVLGNTLTAQPGPYRLENGWLTTSIDGTIESTVAMWGRRAWLESPDPIPADPVPDLTALAGATIEVMVDDPPAVITASAPVPAGLTTVSQFLSFLNRNIAGGRRVWFGVVTRGTDQHIRVESRRVGGSSDVELRLTVAALGFTAATTTATVAGAGSERDMARVSAVDLVARITGGRGITPIAQQALEASLNGTNLQLVATGGSGLTTRVPAGSTSPVAFANPAGRTDVLTAAFAGPLETGPHLAQFELEEQIVGPLARRTVQALVDAAPARLGPMALPANLADLDATTLILNTGAGPATTTLTSVFADVDIIDQLERANEGRVRASIVGSELFVESVAQGTAATVTIDVAGSTAMSGGLLGSPPSPTATGTGDAANILAVTAAEYRDAVNAGFLTPRSIAPNGMTASNVPIGGDAYANPTYADLTSERVGCRSTLELLPLDPTALGHDFAGRLAAGPEALRFDHSLAFAPAVRASVELPPFVGSQPVNGDLWITVNENAVGDVAPSSEVRVTFSGTYDARALADELNDALRQSGVGCAVAFPDDVVVIESLTPGLAGAIEVPSDANTSDASVVTALGLSGASLNNRGWPGSGTTPMRSGFRGYVGPARFAGQLAFLNAAGASVGSTNVAAGEAPEIVAPRLDGLLRDASGARTGLARVADDGSLAVEFFTTGVTVDTSDPTNPADPIGRAIRPDQPRTEEIWEGSDAPIEPIFELRATNVLRTFRMVYFERGGDDDVFLDASLFDPTSDRIHDVGWVRPPTDANGAPQAVDRWAPGRWLFAARAQGARSDSFSGEDRTRAYADDAEMIISGGTATIAGESVAFAHRARYWVNRAPATGGSTATRLRCDSTSLRVVQFGNEFLVDHLVLLD